jgi:histidyl-tRNA synthetase
MPWEDVRKEMTEEKGLAPEIAADKMRPVHELTEEGGRDLLIELKGMPELTANLSFAEGWPEYGAA